MTTQCATCRYAKPADADMIRCIHPDWSLEGATAAKRAGRWKYPTEFDPQYNLTTCRNYREANHA